MEWWQEQGYVSGIELEDGRALAVMQLTYGRGRLLVCGPAPDYWIEEVY